MSNIQNGQYIQKIIIVIILFKMAKLGYQIYKKEDMSGLYNRFKSISCVYLILIGTLIVPKLYT